ncbi:MAG: hypothetical protein NUV37_00575 [Nanoarchaeota archaeon]|nr:hypothetical protein [Nanoarchaeota archaeon]
MVRYYHGTDIGAALAIARDGAIISPYERSLRSLEIRKMKDELMKRYSCKTLEEAVLAFASIGYRDGDVEHRVKRISLTPSKISARGYAIQSGSSGVVLGLELNSNDQEDTLYQRGQNQAIYIPRVELTKLKEIEVFSSSKEEIDKVFAAYEKWGIKRLK